MNKKSGGVGIGTVLALIFIVLKLIGVINWSWIWVLSPLWISLLLVVFLIGVATLCTYYLERDKVKEEGLTEWLKKM